MINKSESYTLLSDNNALSRTRLIGLRIFLKQFVGILVVIFFIALAGASVYAVLTMQIHFQDPVKLPVQFV